MKEALNVCGLQFAYTDGEAPYYDRIDEYVDEIDLKSTDLICFPESSIYGFDYEKLRHCSRQEFERQQTFFKDMAKEYEVNIIAGLVENEGDHHYNSVFVFDRNGEIVHRYRKNYLWAEEKKFFTPGCSNEVFELEGWKLGLGLCADLGFPEFSRSLALNGAEFFVFPSAWREPYDRLWELMVTARAAENQAYMLGLNAVGSKDDYCGNSLALDSHGEVLGKLDKNEGVISFELNKEQVIERREEIGWLYMTRADIYRKLNSC